MVKGRGTNVKEILRVSFVAGERLCLVWRDCEVEKGARQNCCLDVMPCRLFVKLIQDPVVVDNVIAFKNWITQGKNHFSYDTKKMARWLDVIRSLFHSI